MAKMIILKKSITIYLYITRHHTPEGANKVNNPTRATISPESAIKEK